MQPSLASSEMGVVEQPRFRRRQGFSKERSLDNTPRTQLTTPKSLPLQLVPFGISPFICREYALLNEPIVSCNIGLIPLSGSACERMTANRSGAGPWRAGAVAMAGCFLIRQMEPPARECEANRRIGGTVMIQIWYKYPRLLTSRTILSYRVKSSDLEVSLLRMCLRQATISSVHSPKNVSFVTEMRGFLFKSNSVPPITHSHSDSTTTSFSVHETSHFALKLLDGQ